MFDRFEEARVVRAQTGAPEHFQNGRLWKLGRAAQTAVDVIEHIAELHGRSVELLQADCNFARWPRLVRKLRQQSRAILLDPLWFVAKQPGDLAQHVDKGRPSEARLFGKIRSTPNRFGVRRKKHR